MNFIIFLYPLLSFIYILLGVSLLVLEKKYFSFKYFSYILISCGIFVLTLFLSRYTEIMKYSVINTTIYTSLIWFFYFLYKFLQIFPEYKINKSLESKYRYIIVFPILLTILYYLDPIKDIPVYILFILYIIFFTLLYFSIFINKFNYLKGIQKVQLSYALIAMFISLILYLFTELIIPSVLNIETGILSPFITLILFISIAIAITILKHRFLSVPNFLNNVIEILFDNFLLQILFYGIAFFYISVFGQIFTPIVYLIGFFIGIICTVLIRIFFNKINTTHFIKREYDPMKYIKILRDKNYIGQSITYILSDFLSTTRREMGIERITVLNQDNYKINEYSPIFKYLLNSKFSKKLFLAQEERRPFDLIKNSGELSAVITVYHEKELMYVLLLSNRKNYISYDLEDIRVMKEAAERINLIIGKTILTEEQRKFNTTLQEKLNLATEELQKQKENVEERYRTERDMMGIMGHELRTPLTTARGFLEIILSKAKEDPNKPIEEFNHYLDNIYNAFKREIELVQTMLSTSHIDNNKLEINLAEVDLANIVETSILDYKIEAEKKIIDLNYHPMEDLPHIIGDSTRVMEVANNLISNAIKYTHKGQVDIITSYDDEYVYLSVKDTGEGIAEHEIANIGKKFYRVGNYLSQDKLIVRPGGTGLGMYITKAIMEASGGQLKISSKFGEGSTFTAVFKRWNN